MGAIATFDPATFKAEFPEFAALSDPQLNGIFTRATLIFANDGSGPVADAGQQLALLNLLTAHIAWMNAARDAAGNPASTGTAPTATAGRIASASEGSVSLSFDVGSESSSPSQAWYLQTRYGFEFWTATAQYRTARYVARPTRVGQPIFAGWYSGR